jgi:hypothetical protein
MYSNTARERRRCLGTRKDGQPCHAWALWRDERQLCVNHGGHHHVGPLGPSQYWSSLPANYVPCTCWAYPHPHRPAGGLCRWPDPPVYFLNRPPGVHAEFRYRGKYAIFRVLERRFAAERRNGRI